MGAHALPDWSTESATAVMNSLDVATAVLSAPTPGTAFLDDPDDAAAMARDLNDYAAAVVADNPCRFGFFATVPLPHLSRAVDEAVRALDELRADGLMLLGNSAGSYLGQDGQNDLFAVLDERAAVVFVHPAALPGPAVAGMPATVADVLLDTTRAAYLLVRNGIRRRYPDIRFILSHGGGFVPYASHRLAVSAAAETGRPVDDVLTEFAGFHFDTALASSPAALPSLLAFAQPGNVVFGSDCPFAPADVASRFAADLVNYPDLGRDERAAIERINAEGLFPRLSGC